jgi:hypothetical protein
MGDHVRVTVEIMAKRASHPARTGDDDQMGATVGYPSHRAQEPPSSAGIPAMPIDDGAQPHANRMARTTRVEAEAPGLGHVT